MAYEFTEQEQARIQSVYDRAEQGQTPWWGLYEEVSSLLLAAIDRGAVARAKGVGVNCFYFQKVIHSDPFSSGAAAHTTKPDRAEQPK